MFEPFDGLHGLESQLRKFCSSMMVCECGLERMQHTYVKIRISVWHYAHKLPNTDDCHMHNVVEGTSR